MAQVFGQPGEEPGDRQVYKALQNLPAETIVYAQPILIHKRSRRYPDYVIVDRNWGVIVLEVKDWINVKERTRKKALIYRSKTRKSEWEKSPVEQARTSALVLNNMLCDDPDLMNYAGKLDFPYRYAGVLPNLPMPTVSWLEKAWGESYIFGRDDLKRERITEKVSNIPTEFVCKMTERQMRAVRAIIDGRMKIIDGTSGEFKGVYDQEQEKIAKEPIVIMDPAKTEPSDQQQASFDRIINPTPQARVEFLESSVPDEVASLKKAAHVRLVRGFAGTGKTDVLVLRAHYILKQYPDKEILVTTFNRPILDERLRPELEGLGNRVDVISFDGLCSNIYQKKHKQWVTPQNTRGIVSKIAHEESFVDQMGRDFIADEIIWMKESGLTERNKYVNSIREGRGSKSGRKLSKKMKEKIFDVFEIYEDELTDLPAHDWVDLHEKTWKYLQDGIEPDKYYDMILIDEAQHFAPTWMHIIQAFLKPGGSLFIGDDPSQSVYRTFSWRQKGVNVVGRTRWLRIPYRNTRQIFEAAYTLISSNPLAQKMLNENDENILPDLESTFLRDGMPPQVHEFKSFEAEKTFMQSEVGTLTQKGILPGEICILHSQKYVIDAYRNLFGPSIIIDKLKRRTGMEYKVVFIPRVQNLFERDIDHSWEHDQARQQLSFYMAMTRARDHLYLLYGQKWPKSFEPLRKMVEWHTC